MYIHGLLHTHITPCSVSRNNDTSVATRTPMTQILLSNTIFQLKKYKEGPLEIDSRTETKNIQDDPRASFSTRK